MEIQESSSSEMLEVTHKALYLEDFALTGHVQQEPVYAKALMLAFVYLVGALSVVQAGLNIRLADSLGSGTRSATVNFAVSLTSMLPFVFSGPTIAQTKANMALLKYRNILGGFLGTLFIYATIFIPPVLGFAVFFLLVVIGQLSMSILLDHFGIYVTKRPFTITRLFGIAVTLSGVCILRFVNQQSPFSEQGESSALVATFMLLSIVCGSFLPIQAISNKKLASDVFVAPFRVTVITLTSALAFSLFPLGLSFLWIPAQYEPLPPYVFLGGLCGMMYIVSATHFTQFLGVAAYFVTMICGQISAALLVDHVGAFDAEQESLNWSRALGALLTIMGAVLIQGNQDYIKTAYHRVLTHS